MTNHSAINIRIVQLFGLMLLGTLIYIGSSVMMPLGFAFLLSILLLPVYRFFKRLKFPNVLAILLSVLVALILFFGFFTILVIQINKFIGDFPAIEANVHKHVAAVGSWIEQQVGVSTQKQGEMIKEQLKKLMESAVLWWGAQRLL
jgi:predicted PurR-regulated permease PerM